MQEYENKINFTDIIKRLAKIIERNSGIYPYDKKIAYELGLSATQFSNNKKRNKIPHAEISSFCNKNGIIINNVLYGEDAMNIKNDDESFKG